MKKLELTKERLLSWTRKEGECLVWIGSTGAYRYGQIKHAGKMRRAHRVMYELHYGVSPGPKVVRHSCDNSLCVNPEHLILGTQADNVQDMLVRNRHKPLSGAENGRAKLDADKVREIRRRFKARHRRDGARALGREFGVSFVAIMEAVRGNTWKGVS